MGEAKYAVARLRQPTVLHDHDYLEVTVVHEPVDHPRSEPDHLHRIEVGLLEPGGGEGLWSALAPYYYVPLRARQVHVRGAAAYTVRGRGVVDRQVRNSNCPGGP